jgi:uncharacterized membrane protein YkvA (DUF1232 family)
MGTPSGQINRGAEPDRSACNVSAGSRVGASEVSMRATTQATRWPKAAWVVFSVGWVFFQLLYLISPIDLIPDVLPLLGWADDLLGLGASLVVAAHSVQSALAARPVIAAAPAVAGYEPVPVDELRRW